MVKKMRSLENLKLDEKIVIVRANLDVPIENGEVSDLTILKSASKTIKYLIDKHCKVIVIGSLGDPKGEYIDSLSLMPVRFALGNTLSTSVKFADIKHCENSIKFMEFGDVLMIENLKFNPEEESKIDEKRIEFVKHLSELANAYIYDDFSEDRKFASVYDLPKLIKKKAVGFQVLNEINKLNEFKKIKTDNYLVIFGGKIKDAKLEYIINDISNINKLMLGGEMSYLFFQALGKKVKELNATKEQINSAKTILKLIKERNIELLLPSDQVLENSKIQNINGEEILRGYDIGPKTIEEYSKIIESSNKILLYGPMGEYKNENFRVGSNIITEEVAFNTEQNTFKIAGGKATLKIFNNLKLKNKRFTHISTSGSLMLNFLGGQNNNNIEILQ